MGALDFVTMLPRLVERQDLNLIFTETVSTMRDGPTL